MDVPLTTPHPGLAEFTIGRTFGATRWLAHPLPQGERVIHSAARESASHSRNARASRGVTSG
jgi:hypothetical protein